MSVQRWAKRKGSDAERDLVGKFWQEGWSAHRIAGSGSSSYPSPDIIAGTPSRKLAIEVKKTKDLIKYFSEEEIKALRDFSSVFGAEPWVAVQFASEPWAFFTVDDLQKTGKQWRIKKEDSPLKGLLFEEITKG